MFTYMEIDRFREPWPAQAAEVLRELGDPLAYLAVCCRGGAACISQFGSLGYFYAPNPIAEVIFDAFMGADAGDLEPVKALTPYAKEAWEHATSLPGPRARRRGAAEAAIASLCAAVEKLDLTSEET